MMQEICREERRKSHGENAEDSCAEDLQIQYFVVCLEADA
jgi:hypothetical protein